MCTCLSHLPSSLQGPFATFHVRQDYAGCEWTGLKFSNDGKRILISTNIAQLKLVDAFQGHELNTLSVKYCNNEKLCYICMHICLCISRSRNPQKGKLSLEVQCACIYLYIQGQGSHYVYTWKYLRLPLLLFLHVHVLHGIRHMLLKTLLRKSLKRVIVAQRIKNYIFPLMWFLIVTNTCML